MHHLAYLTTYCTKNEHNSSITFLSYGLRQKMCDGQTDGWTAEQTDNT